MVDLHRDNLLNENASGCLSSSPFDFHIVLIMWLFPGGCYSCASKRTNATFLLVLLTSHARSHAHMHACVHTHSPTLSHFLPLSTISLPLTPTFTPSHTHFLVHSVSLTNTLFRLFYSCSCKPSFFNSLSLSFFLSLSLSLSLSHTHSHMCFLCFPAILT